MRIFGRIIFWTFAIWITVNVLAAGFNAARAHGGGLDGGGCHTVGGKGSGGEYHCHPKKKSSSYSSPYSRPISNHSKPDGDYCNLESGVVGVIKNGECVYDDPNKELEQRKRLIEAYQRRLNEMKGKFSTGSMDSKRIEEALKHLREQERIMREERKNRVLLDNLLEKIERKFPSE